MIQTKSAAEILRSLGARMKMGLGGRIAHANDRPRNRQPAMMRKLPGDHLGLVIPADNLSNRVQWNRHQAIAFDQDLLNGRQFP